MLLQERGDALKRAKFKKVAKIEDKLTKKKNELFEQINTPCKMYTIVGTTIAANKLQEVGEMEIDGEKIVFEKATNPTNIKWENVQFSSTYVRNKTICASLVFIIFGLMLFFASQ